MPVAVAIATAIVAVSAASVAGYLVLGDDGSDGGEDGGKDKHHTARASASRHSPDSSRSPDAPGSPSKDPAKPVVQGWQTVVSPKQYAAFDVPRTKDWKPRTTSWVDYVEDSKGKPVIGLNAPAHYKEGYCKDGWLGTVGTSGAKGATTTAQAARQKTADWARYGYDPKDEGTTKASRVKPFRNAHGIHGHLSRATITGVPKDSKCAARGGKAVTLAWINSEGDIATWTALADTGSGKGGISDKEIRTMASSLRPYEAPNGEAEPRG